MVILGVILLIIGIIGFCFALCAGIGRDPADDEEQLKYIDRWMEIHAQQKRNHDGLR